MKNTKPSKNPPVTAPGKVKLDDALENPRGYLKGLDDSVRAGHTKITQDLDHCDHERNQERMGRRHHLSNEPENDTA